MKILPLDDANRDLFALCLEDWSDEAREGGPRRARWMAEHPGLRAQLALDDAGTVGAMIQYLPVEQWIVRGEGLYVIPCTWVHGHKQGRGDFRGHGMGSALLEAAEADARAMGATGMAAWGLWIPIWMRASFYKKHGYRKADRQGVSLLVWKPFTAEARPPRWVPEGKAPREKAPGKVVVTIYSTGWCMAQNIAAERLRRAAAELGDKVEVQEHDTSRREDVIRHGFSDALFVDGKAVRNGPPPTFEAVRKLLQKRVRGL